MGTVSYYFAKSLDGYIARLDGKVDWLDAYMSPLETPYDFEAYLQTVSAVVMGRQTFEVAKELGPLPLGGNPGFVYTQNPLYQAHSSEVTVIRSDIAGHIQTLKKECKGRIWILGGSVLAGYLLEQKLLDEIAMTTVPVMIGDGIPWIAKSSLDSSWELVENYATSHGIVQSVYQRKLTS